MPKHSNVSDSPHCDRQRVTEDLYLEGGARDASHRCDVNTNLGNFDLLETLIAALDLAPGKTVVDAGCGSGQHLARFSAIVGPSGLARGFDVSPDAVAATTDRGLDAEAADLANLSLQDASADALTCNYAVYYHPRIGDVVAEWARVLKPGARLAVSGPAADNNRELYEFHREVTGSALSDADQMALGYVENTFVPALNDAAFEDVEVAVHTNRIRFPDASSFLAYWRSTSLFLRTEGAGFEAGQKRLADHDGEFIVTKRVAIVTATRR